MTKKIKVEQIGSPIRRQDYQEKCLKGLGLGKLHRVKELEDTPSVRGIIRKVAHLVKII
ncbi:MAG: 50S ribosomal protein L30 [Alphaproteobacteria bacterium]